MTHQLASYTIYTISAACVVLTVLMDKNKSMSKNKYLPYIIMTGFLIVLVIALNAPSNRATEIPSNRNEKETSAELKMISAEYEAMNKFMEQGLLTPLNHDFFIDWNRRFDALQLLNNNDYKATMMKAQELLDEMYKQYPSTQPTAAERLRLAADEIEKKENEKKRQELRDKWSNMRFEGHP